MKSLVLACDMQSLNRNWRSGRDFRKSAQGGKKTTGFKSGGDAASNASKGSKPLTGHRAVRRHVNPMYVVITRFKKIFSSYDENMQTTEIKRASLNIAVCLSKKYYPDRFRFWQDLLDEANILLDSRRFNTSCEEMKLDPQAVAEHLVVEGKATVNRVLKYGLENYGEKAKMFHERLYVDTRKLYRKDEEVAPATEDRA